MNISAASKLLGEIYRLVESGKQSLLQVVAMGAVLASIDLLGLYLLGKFVAMTAASESALSLQAFGWYLPVSYDRAAIILGIVYVGRAILGIGANHKINLIAANLEADLKATILLQYQVMPYAERMRRGIGEMSEAVSVWTASFVRAVFSPLSRFISESIISITISAYFLYLYPKVILFFCVLAVVAVISYDMLVKRKANASASAYRQASTQLSEEIQNTLSGYKEIIGFGLPRFFSNKIHSSARKMCGSLAKAITFAQAPRLVIEAFLVVCAVVVLWGMTYVGRDVRAELPNIAMIAVGVMRISSWFSLTTSMLSNMRLYRPIVSSLALDLGVGENSFLGPAVKPAKTVASREMTYLSAENISFAYDENRRIFSGLDFKIEAGDRVAIVGPSGAGKTTLLDVMMGLIKPTTGGVTVHISDGSSQGNLLGIGSYLSQSTFILNDTVRRNVALGVPDEEIDDERVKMSLRRAMLPEFAEEMGLERVLGSSGALISGGQKQRVSIARAFYFGRSVFLFDEATSALDLQTELEIIRVLFDMGRNITLIVVTHNQDLVAKFNKKIEITADFSGVDTLAYPNKVGHSSGLL
jgi:ABC-type multidrug transport system fused ATPase/permease subunit